MIIKWETSNLYMKRKMNQETSKSALHSYGSGIFVGLISCVCSKSSQQQQRKKKSVFPPRGVW